MERSAVLGGGWLHALRGGGRAPARAGRVARIGTAPAPTPVVERQAAAPDNVLAISDLSFAYGSGRPVLENVDLQVRRGEFVCLIGPSGCGKSSLLRVVMGLAQARTGSVDLGVARGDIGFLFQDNALLPWRSARYNVALGLMLRGAKRAAAEAEAERWLDAVGLHGLGDRYPRALSGGQQKRVAIAQVLALRPKLLLMDEPFASLDAILRRTITEDLLAWVERERTTVLMVTHDLDEAASVADRIVLLGNGPGAHVAARFDVPLARPRDLAHVRELPDYAPLVARMWDALSREIHVPRSALRDPAAVR